MLYADKHEGNCPNSLNDLVSEGYFDEKILRCPTDKTSSPVSYVYLGAGKKYRTLGAEIIVAYDPIATHEEGSNVLFGDGHVEFVDKDTLTKMLAGPSTSQPN